MTAIQRVLVVGPGALGRLFAVRLHKAAVAVTLLDHDSERARDLSLGIRVSEPGRSVERVVLPVVTPEELSSMAPFDLLVSCVKSRDTMEALESSVAALDPRGAVLVLSNGLGNVEIASALVGLHRVLAGATVCGAVAESRRLHIHGIGPTRVGPYGQDSARAARQNGSSRNAERVAAVLGRAGFPVDVRADMEPILWEKVAINCGINPAATILGIENGQLLHQSLFRWSVRAAEEVAAVARAKGLTVPVDGWAERVTAVCHGTASNRCSMLVDRDRGRPSEIEALCGRVTSLGAELGVPTPVNAQFLARIRSLETLRVSGDPGGISSAVEDGHTPRWIPRHTPSIRTEELPLSAALVRGSMIVKTQKRSEP